jgi:acyl-CoA dehydrogenase
MRKKRTRGGVTAFVVEKGMPGFIVGYPDQKMGIKGSQTCELVFKNCRVPRENVIGGVSMVGQGFKTAMRVLDKGRLTMGGLRLGGIPGNAGYVPGQGSGQHGFRDP